MQKLLVIIFLGILITGCGAGSTSPEPSISIDIESGYSCTNMHNGSPPCNIVITYTTNDNIDPVLGYTPTPPPLGMTINGSFYNSVDICQESIDSVSSGTCIISFTYSSNYSQTNTD